MTKLLEYIVVYINSRVLRESETSFKASQIVPRAEQERLHKKFDDKAKTNEGKTEIIESAQKHNNDAILYLWLHFANRIETTFWKAYLGPNKSAQRGRIQSGAWNEWISIAYQVLVDGFKEYRDAKGLLSSFNVEKFKEGDIFESMGYMFTSLLKNAAIEANYKTTTGGMTNVGGMRDGSYRDKAVADYDPKVSDAQQEKHDVSNPTLDSVLDTESNSEFLKSWREFCQDEALCKETNGVTPGVIFRAALLRKNAADESSLMEAYPQVSRNTIQKLLKTAADLCKDKYMISGTQLIKALEKYGADKVASLLTMAEPRAMKTISKETKTSSTDDANMAKWEALVDIPKLWNNKRKGWCIATVMYEFLTDPKYTPQKLAKEARIPFKGYAEHYDKGIDKYLQKVGFASRQEFNKFANKVGRKKLANMIMEKER